MWPNPSESPKLSKVPPGLAMEKKSALQQTDELLRPLLSAAKEDDSKRLLAELISKHAEPIIRRVIRQKLRAWHSKPGDHLVRDAEDLFGEAIVQLLSRLRGLRENPAARPIGNFRNYVAVITYNAFNQSIRRSYPQRHYLKNRLRYLMTHQPGIAVWEAPDGQWLCGLAEWRGRSVTGSGDRLHALDRAVVPLETVQRGNLAELLDALFTRLNAPVEIDELVSTIGDWLGIKEQPPGSDRDSDEADESLEQLPDPSASVAAKVEQRMYLERLWAEICLLPTRQRAALLLNLRDDQDHNVIALFPLTNAASFREIAEALAMPAEQLAELWNRLPLDDATIADSLGVTRQQVINLRKSARERLARRMRALGEGFRAHGKIRS